MAYERLKQFLKLEAAGGILLVLAAVAALICANTPGLSVFYQGLLDIPMEIKLGPLELRKNFLLVVNDGLMAVFFLLVALEIKREVIAGELSSLSQVVLPGCAAIGGIAVPALCYYYFNASDPVAVHGWAIPAATDIAFSLGVLSLFGSRVPLSFKVFLTTIAVIDDLVAILIIAIFYTSSLSVDALILGGVGLYALFVFNRIGITRFAPYFIVGIIVWICVLKSGVHATLAGVALGFTIPFATKKEGEKSPLVHLEHILHPWVAYAILPIFAFANAGIALGGVNSEILTSGITLGAAVGLFLGKPIGVCGVAAILVLLKIAKLPESMNWTSLLAIGFLTGIGFTMSLFIGSLAFQDVVGDFDLPTKVGVFVGSLAAAAVGAFLLKISLPKPQKTSVPD